MRTLSPALAAHLAGDALTLATCVRLTRRDGARFGFTTASDALLVGGLLYQPAQGLNSSQFQAATGTGVDNLDMRGLLTSDAITETDIRAGRYDGAELLAFVVNWADLTMGAMILARGSVGEVTVQAGQFVAEFRSLSQKLAQQVGDVTSAVCNVRDLGDARCKLPMGGYRFAVTVASVPDLRTLTFAGRPEEGQWFRYGKLTPLAGLNAGLVMGISAHARAAGDVAVLTLREPFPFDVAAGDAMTLETGCDRTWDSCRLKFHNAVNFRGLPFIPGNNTLLEQGRG